MIQCKNCLKKLLINAQSCKHCGALVHPIPIEYFYTPPLRFLLLSFISFGSWYHIYWFYKNWAAVKKAQSIKSMRPFWRAFFLEFFCWSLFNRVYRDASKYGYKHRRAFHLITLFSMGIYFSLSVILPVILSILSRIINYTPISGVLILFLLLLLPVSLLKVIAILITQRAIKFHNTYAIPGYQARRKLTKGEMVFVVLGCVIWLAAIIKIALG